MIDNIIIFTCGFVIVELIFIMFDVAAIKQLMEKK